MRTCSFEGFSGTWHIAKQEANIDTETKKNTLRFVFIYSTCVYQIVCGFSVLALFISLPVHHDPKPSRNGPVGGSESLQWWAFRGD